MAALDEYQQAAVAHGDGPAIVLAGPGSGKTRVIVERAVRLIDEEHARPEQLLVLTFSRKAATDLRERLAARLQRSYATFPVTTFHAFCFSLLAARRAPSRRGSREPAERRELMRAALAAARQPRPARRRNALIEEALAFAALCDDYLDAARARARAACASATSARSPSAARSTTAASSARRSRCSSSDDEPRRAYQSAFRYVLVDEYQDTNVAQERLLELLAGEHRNVFCVADEDQSIYGFRGAEIENALGFEERWPGARRYDLPTNYRSAPRDRRARDERHPPQHRHAPRQGAARRRRTARRELVGRTFRHAAEEADWIAREVAAPAAGRRRRSARSPCSPAR